MGGERHRPDAEERRRRRGRPTMGPKLNISVPISFGLPIMAVGLAFLFAGVRTGSTLFWILGVVGLGGGLLLFTTGKSL